jgi:diguanylate cyclase (GGDEF)-like protein
MTMLLTVTALAAGLGTPAFALSSVRVARLTRQLTTDRLTGLGNRDALVRTFRCARRRGPVVGVLLLDLDGFKQVDDRYGHDVGNVVLSHVGKRLQSVCGSGELAERLHGDEFAVLLTRLPAADGQGHAEERAGAITAALAAPVEVDGARVLVSASAGAAVCAVEHAGLSALLRAADQRMYAAKRGAAGSEAPVVAAGRAAAGRAER